MAEISLLAQAVVILVVLGALIYALGLWPMAPDASGDPPDPVAASGPNADAGPFPPAGRGLARPREPRPTQRGVWPALILVSLIASYSTWICARLEHHNRLAGDFLPTEYHPKGWRYFPPGDKRLFRMERQIWGGRPLTSQEQSDFVGWSAEIDSLNALHRTAEEALKLYVLVPIGLIWAAGLGTRHGSPLVLRGLSVACAGLLAGCGHVLISRAVFTALLGTRWPARRCVLHLREHHGDDCPRAEVTR